MRYSCLDDYKGMLWFNLSSRFDSTYKMEPDLTEKDKQFIAHTQVLDSRFYFITLVDEGGIIDNDKEFEDLLNNKKKDELAEVADFIIRKGKLTEGMYDLALIYIIRLHVLTCYKLAKDKTIYKQIIDINGWND